mmetsp:Transcript_40055/g.113402  ORF Transcript_40055/g.113402 Transcript_40055/m.113402 type:complete len:234 (-) Transcript_40055:59-760(-)
MTDPKLCINSCCSPSSRGVASNPLATNCIITRLNKLKTKASMTKLQKRDANEPINDNAIRRKGNANCKTRTTRKARANLSKRNVRRKEMLPFEGSSSTTMSETRSKHDCATKTRSNTLHFHASLQKKKSLWTHNRNNTSKPKNAVRPDSVLRKAAGTSSPRFDICRSMTSIMTTTFAAMETATNACQALLRMRDAAGPERGGSRSSNHQLAPRRTAASRTSCCVGATPGDCPI